MDRYRGIIFAQLDKGKKKICEFLNERGCNVPGEMTAMAPLIPHKTYCTAAGCARCVSRAKTVTARRPTADNERTKDDATSGRQWHGLDE